MLTAVTLTLAAGVLAAPALAMAYVLGWANKAFHVETDPKVEAIQAVLPGANCGGCGYVGCAEYAEAVVRDGADITLCGPGGAGCVKRMAEILGVEVSETLPYKAVVHCAATWDMRLQKMEYRGEMTCEAANLVSGFQGCVYGCLGLGDCVRSCDFDAIHVVDGLARVDYGKCTGCKACARVCPRNIITMVPFKKERIMVVACSNEDFGNDVKAVCKVGCIGCKACTRVTNLMHMEGNLPILDYDHYDPDEDMTPVLDKCRMESLVFVGKPSEAGKAAVAHEEVPERVTANFETTVDKTDWWG